MTEKAANKSLERPGDRTTEHQTVNHEQHERLRDNLERNAERSRAERSPDESVERRNAERLAESSEQSPAEDNVEAQPERRRATPSSRRERDQAYDAIMADAREHMSPAERTFSKFIHHRAVEGTSNAVAATIARPNAIVAGSFTAFIVVLGVFLVARHYGYPLSGSETIVAFAAGWVIGIVFDYLRTMIAGRH